MLISLFGCLQYLFSVGIPSPWNLERRITSIFDYPNALALFLEPIVILSWFQIKKTWSRENVFWITVCSLSIINIFLAQSEAALAALGLGAILFLLSKKHARRATFIFGSVLIVLLTIIPTTRFYFLEKATFQDYSLQVRQSQWKETVSFLRDHPFMGAGLSGYPERMKSYHQDLRFEIFQYPHNILLNMYTELGLAGVIVSIILLLQLIKQGFSNNTSSANTQILFLLLFTTILHGMVDVPYFKNDLALLSWILLALLCTKPSRKKINTQ